MNHSRLAAVMVACLLATVAGVPAAAAGRDEDPDPPYSYGHDPAPGETEVPAQAPIVVRIADEGLGVDASSIVMTVDGRLVTPVVEGTPADLLLTWQPILHFYPGQMIAVTLDASDLAGNAMLQDAYGFTATEAEWTPRPTFTPTPEPSATPTAVPTATGTPAPPTATPEPPTATPTAAPATATPLPPSATPQPPSATATPLPPTATVPPSPAPPPVMADVWTNQPLYRTGDFFEAGVLLACEGPSLAVDLYVVLDVWGGYYFWPEWAAEIGARSFELAAGEPLEVDVLAFVWPPGVGAGEGIALWAGAVRAGTSEIASNIDRAEFGFE